MRPVMDQQSALRAIDQLGADLVLATSIPAPARQLSNLLASDEKPLLATVDHQDSVPHGTGDLMSALYLGAVT